MILDGDFTFRAPRRSVWKLLQDPEVLVKAMPGAQRLVATGDGTYEGTIRIGVGPVTAAQWTLSVALHDREEPARYLMKVESKGPLGFTRGSASVELTDEAEGTRMRYHADLQIGGKVAGIGQRLLDQVAKMMTRQGLEALSREMQLRLSASVGSATASFGVAAGTVMEGEIIVIDENADPAAGATDDAAAVNPESGEPGTDETASSGDGDAAMRPASARPSGSSSVDGGGADDATDASGAAAAAAAVAVDAHETGSLASDAHPADSTAGGASASRVASADRSTAGAGAAGATRAAGDEDPATRAAEALTAGAMVGDDALPDADDAGAGAVEPLAETATPGAPLPPGLDGHPAPVADLDAELPPGTV